MYKLPVSGFEVTFRQPKGVEDLLLCESAALDSVLALALISRLASPLHDWNTLCVTDFETLLLLLRHTVLGSLIQAYAKCAAPACQARVDLSFRVAQYVAHHIPRTPKRVRRDGQSEWFLFADDGVRFRLPVVADLTTAAGHAGPEIELLRRCVDAPRVPARVRDRVERAMEALAPSLSHEVKGQCPQCHSKIAMYFDVQAFVLRELRNRAASIYRDIHLLASQYNWREKDILALPRHRRSRYAAIIADGGLI